MEGGRLPISLRLLEIQIVDYRLLMPLLSDVRGLTDVSIKRFKKQIKVHMCIQRLRMIPKIMHYTREDRVSRNRIRMIKYTPSEML